MLIDDFFEQRNESKLKSNFAELPSDFWTQFVDSEKPQVFKVDNVCEYMNAKKNEWLWKDFPNIAPVYRSAWFEWTLKNDHRQTMGVLVSSAECQTAEESRSTIRELKMLMMAKHGVADDFTHSFLNQMNVPPEELKWIVQMTMFVRFNIEKMLVYMGNTFIFVKENGETFSNEDGTMKGIMTQPSNWIINALQGREEIGHEGPLAYAQSIAAVPCMSLSFLHARGIKSVAAEPISEALQRSRVKRGRLPLFRHHVLVLDLPRKIIKEGNHGSEDLTPQALHLVRGHFKHFDDKPLFGKYRGTWFWAPTVKGSREFGEVTKDYEIKVPKEL